MNALKKINPLTGFQLLFWLVAVFVLIYRLDAFPPLWWDEGWTLSVAKNWVEHGFIGLFDEGLPRSPGLAGHLPTVALTAMGFKLFGIGIWQARLPFIVLTLLSIFLVSELARNLFNRNTARVAVIIGVFLPLAPDLQPVIFGRQVLGETPAVLLILVGSLTLFRGLQKQNLFLIIASVCFGAAMYSKTQVPPFILFAFLVTGLFLLREKSWSVIGKTMAVGVGSYVMYRLLGLIPGWLNLPIIQGEYVPGLFGVTAFVFNPSIRVIAARDIIVYGLPAIIGMMLSAFPIIRNHHVHAEASLISRSTVSVFLISFIAGWMGWYGLLGMNWIRYIFIPVFLGSIFIANGLSIWTKDFRIKTWLMTGIENLTLRDMRLPGFRDIVSGAAVLLTIAWFSISILIVSAQYALQMGYQRGPPEIEAVALFLNEHVSLDERIGTYESELLFLLDGIYTFPPDRVSVELIRKTTFGDHSEISYDPDQESLDFIIIGPFGKMWGLYDETISNEVFELIKEFPNYRIFARSRP